MAALQETLRIPALQDIARFRREHVTPTIAGGLAVGAVLGLIELGAIVVHAHGTVSHDATQEAPWLAAANDVVMASLGATAQTWGAAHVGDVEVEDKQEGIMHHGMTDATTYPSYIIERYLRVIEADPERYKGFPTLPTEGFIPNLDPGANFTPQELRQVGSFGYNIMDTVLGEEHIVPQSYTREEAETIMDTSYPRYPYGPAVRHPKGQPYTVEESAVVLQSDPYSPPLEQLDDQVRNGAKAIDKRNVTRFRIAADYFRARPDHIRPMLKDVKNYAPETTKGPVYLFSATIAGACAIFARKKGLSASSLAKGVVAGAIAGGVAVGGPIEGGEKTNAYGHAGFLDDPLDLIKLWRNEPMELKPNPIDGSYMTYLGEPKNLAGKVVKTMFRIANYAAADEILNQPEHHASPGRRSYTAKKGLGRIVEAPGTTLIQYVSNRKRFRFGLRPGQNFGLPEGAHRPDEVNSIVRDVIQPARLRTHYPEQYEAYLAEKAALLEAA
ncbi:MAG: hypothetical protein KIH63_005565 [Candidatus Saccharibacteria bacterium]|nr:hypothetical protein [Candidatus Saccharibacteria bacterium]